MALLTKEWMWLLFESFSLSSSCGVSFSGSLSCLFGPTRTRREYPRLLSPSASNRRFKWPLVTLGCSFLCSRFRFSSCWGGRESSLLPSFKPKPQQLFFLHTSFIPNLFGARSPNCWRRVSCSPLPTSQWRWMVEPSIEDVFILKTLKPFHIWLPFTSFGDNIHASV